MVMGGLGVLPVFAVMPDTTDGVPPVGAAIDCTGAAVTLGKTKLVAATGFRRPAPAGYQAAGKEERTIGSISRTCATTLCRLHLGYLMSSGCTFLKSSTERRWEK